jgi:hypothetical protein
MCISREINVLLLGRYYHSSSREKTTVPAAPYLCGSFLLAAPTPCPAISTGYEYPQRGVQKFLPPPVPMQNLGLYHCMVRGKVLQVPHHYWCFQHSRSLLVIALTLTTSKENSIIITIIVATMLTIGVATQ